MWNPAALLPLSPCCVPPQPLVTKSCCCHGASSLGGVCSCGLGKSCPGPFPRLVGYFPLLLQGGLGGFVISWQVQKNLRVKPRTDLVAKLVTGSCARVPSRRSEGEADCTGCTSFGAEHPQINLNCFKWKF